MTRKLRFKWPDQNERTISDIVENDGTMRSREVLYIIEKLCTLLRTPDKGNKESAWNSETAGFAAPAAGSDSAELQLLRLYQILQNRQILQPYRTLPAPHLLSRIRIVRKVRSIRAIPRLKPVVLHTYIRTTYW